MMMERDDLIAGANDIKDSRMNYKVGMYFTLVILLIIAIWVFASQSRWLIFDSGIGTRRSFDFWIVAGVIVTAVGAMMAFFVLGQMSKGLSRECEMLGGFIHLEERQIVLLWAVVIGMVLGMGFWDIVTMAHLAITYGILNIWSIPVTVFDLGAFKLIVPVWGLVIIGVVKMSAVILLYALAMKNMRRGTICNLVNFEPNAILD